MNSTTPTYSYRSGAAFRSFAALAALAATVATLSLAVVTPAALAPTDAPVLAKATAVEVAILPGSIHVVALRAPVARAASPFVPAAYRPHG